MKIFLFFVCVAIMSIPSTAVSGEVYGTVILQGKYAKQKVVTIRCPSGTYDGSTDNYGGYSIYVRDSGPCILFVQGHELRFRSFSKPVKVNVTF